MTAVEWLAEQLIESHYSDVIDKALEMERQQIIDAFNIEIYEGEDDNFRNAEQYYNETFKSK